MDLSRTAQSQMATLETLTDLRTDAGFEDAFKRATALCEKNNIEHLKDGMVLCWSQPVGQSVNVQTDHFG